MSAKPTAKKLRTKHDADQAILEINRIERRHAAIDAAHDKAAAHAKKPGEARKRQLLALLADFGDKRIPTEDGSDQPQTINLRRDRKVYRFRTTEVIFDLPEKKIVEALRRKPFWRLRFLNVKISVTVNKDAVKKWPYITQKVKGLRIKHKNDLYLQKGGGTKSVLLEEHEIAP